MPFDLPIDDVKVYVEDAINQLGLNCTVDGSPTKIMISDTTDSANVLVEYTKLAVVSKDINIKKGSKVVFDDERLAIVFTIPNDDMVSYSTKILLCNSTLSIYNNITLYNETGDLLDNVKFYKPELNGFIERISAKEKMLDLGIVSEAVLRFITFSDSNVDLEDIVEFKGKTYKIVDIDNVTEGLLVLQLASVVK